MKKTLYFSRSALLGTARKHRCAFGEKGPLWAYKQVLFQM